MPPGTEADTCRQYVLPKLYAAGWDDDRIAEQRTFTDGRIVVTGSKVRRRPGKRADYILRYRAGMPIAVVEANPSFKTPAEGLQQAKDYAEILEHFQRPYQAGMTAMSRPQRSAIARPLLPADAGRCERCLYQRSGFTGPRCLSSGNAMCSSFSPG